MQIGSHIAKCILRDMSISAKLLAELCPLGICLRELAIEWLQESKQMLCLYAGCT